MKVKISKEFENQLLDNNIDVDNVSTFSSKYDKLSNSIVTKIVMKDDRECSLKNPCTWFAVRKNKKW